MKKGWTTSLFSFSVGLSHFSFSATIVNLVIPQGEMLNGFLLPR